MVVILKGGRSYQKVVNYKNVQNFKLIIFVVDNFLIALNAEEICGSKVSREMQTARCFSRYISRRFTAIKKLSTNKMRKFKFPTTL